MSYAPRVFAHFDRALLRARTSLSLFQFIERSAPPALDATDLLRASVVLGVSALDYLVHLLIRFEIEDRVLRKRSITGVTIPIGFAHLDEASLIKSAGLHIKGLNSYKSFVSPAKMAEGLKSLLESPWDDISTAFGSIPTELKTKLTLVVDLRNRISHEGDLDPETLTPISYDIDSQDVSETIEFIDKLGKALIEAVISRQSEMSMSDFTRANTFPVNLRPTAKGTPKGSFTVHRLPNGCRHARDFPSNSLWSEEVRWTGIRRLARTKSLGCCKRCWRGDSELRTSELQGLLET